jgi:hypothetical protein
MTEMSTRSIDRRRVVALALFWIAQFVLVVVVGFLVGILLTFLEGDSFRYDAFGSYLHSLVDWGKGSMLLASYILVVTGTTLFVAPVVGPLRLTTTGRPLRTSVIGAAILGGLISFLLLGAAIELPLRFATDLNVGDATLAWPGILISWTVAGGVWAAVLWRVGRERDPAGLDRLFRQLLAATMLEVALAVPIYLIARRKTNCFCSLHSFLALIGGVVTLCMLCGPWAVLFLTREARRGWQRGACPRCGYPQRSGSSQCSECGSLLSDATA